jgi:hypothetical protein
VPCSRSSRRAAVSAASSFSDHFLVGPGEPPHLIGSQAKAGSTVRNDWPLQMASRSCCLTSTGSRLCARARPQARWVSLCALRHCVHLQPACQWADVPCAASLTKGKASGRHLSKDVEKLLRAIIDKSPKVSRECKNGDLPSDLYEFNGFVGTISSGRSKMAK